MELEIRVAGIYHQRTQRLALQVGPALALDNRVDPDSLAIPPVPDRRDMRDIAGAERAQAAGALLGQEGIALFHRHGNPPRPPLLLHGAELSHQRLPLSDAARHDSTVIKWPSPGGGVELARELELRSRIGFGDSRAAP